MAKKKVEVSQNKEDKTLEEESNRLRELACSFGLLSEEKAVPEKQLRPKLGIKKCDGKDICKKGHRKNKYLFSFPGLVAAVAGGKFGELAQLDSRNPILYVDFPKGRLKLFGTIVYPKNKYITMNFVRGAGNIQCEDLFESMVVFPEAWWIGTKEENPDELRLEMPDDLQQEKHAKYEFAGGAGDPNDGIDVILTPSEPVHAMQLEPNKLVTPKGQLKMDQWLLQKKHPERRSSSPELNAKHKFASEWQLDEDDSGDNNLEDAPTSARHSARTVGKKYSYAESPSEEDGTNGSGGSDDLDAEIVCKIINKLYGRKDAGDGLLVHESQASKKDVADMAIIIDEDDDEETNIMDHLVASQTPARSTTDCVLSTPVQALANASTGVSGSKQSSLATFFVKSSEKKDVNVEAGVSVVKIDQLQKSSTSELLPYTPSKSNGLKRKRRAPSEGKKTPNGSE